MRRNKLISAALGAALAIFSHAAYAQNSQGYWQEVQKAGVLRCGAATAPPHVIRDPSTGEYSGTFVDLCREFGEKQLGVKVEIVDTSWDNMVAGLQAGRWDLSLALNRTPKRALAVAFSRPAWNYEITGIYDKANPKFATAPISLQDVDKAGVTIGIMSGTAGDQLLTDHIKAATLLRLPDIDATRLALSSHRADILFDDGDSNALFAATDKSRWVSLAPSPAISKQGIGFALRRSAAAADLQALDIFIEDKQATGEIAAIGKKYIDTIAAASK